MKQVHGGNLRRLAGQTALPLVQLLGEPWERPWDLEQSGDPRTVADLIAPEGLREIARYAAAIGCHKRLVVPAGSDGRTSPPTSLVADAHEDEVHAEGDRVFAVPARLGRPRGVGGLTEVVSSPSLSTAVGLALYGMENEERSVPRNRDLSEPGIFSRVAGWFQGVLARSGRWQR